MRSSPRVFRYIKEEGHHHHTEHGLVLWHIHEGDEGPQRVIRHRHDDDPPCEDPECTVIAK